MKRITRTLGLVAAGAAFFSLTGCVDVKTIVSVSRDGNTITLREIDFGKIIENEEVFSEIMNKKIESLKSLKRYVERGEGLKAEAVRPVEVVLK
ncbi:MAG: hypothetical protein ACLFRY_04460 [Spirochaetia bacterium]